MCISLKFFFFYFYDSFVGMTWHKSYFATLYHDDNANQSYQHTFEGRMGMNRHESYIRPILSLYFYSQRSQS